MAEYSPSIFFVTVDFAVTGGFQDFRRGFVLLNIIQKCSRIIREIKMNSAL
jgi:hypothetical protein